MNDIINLLDWVGRVSAALWLIAIVVGISGWVNGIRPALIRLGTGFAKRKIAIFAKGEMQSSLKNLLLDSKLFKSKNIIEIASRGDFSRAEQATIYLVYWPDWPDDMLELLKRKKDGTALVVYAPQDKGRIPQEVIDEINKERNVAVSNLRGRLLNDIVGCLITTGYI
ncbi:MAG TPA: hypothetical protein VH540_01235 [Ktedonobacterales bacterium]|jgi:hypothetical protein